MILAISGITMLIVLAAWLRRPEAVAAGSERVDVLAAQAAALDARFKALGANAKAAERRDYEKERAELKARLAQALAGGRTTR
jgi:hypothetical protein